MGTKNKSAGTQITPRGPTQGVTLVDHKTGLPFDSLVDGNQVRRLAVDADINIDSATINVDLDASNDNVAIRNTNNTNELLLHSDGSISVRLNDATGTPFSAGNPLPVSIAGGLDVVISHVNDSIKVGDGTEFLAINTDGSINIIDSSKVLDGQLAVPASDTGNIFAGFDGTNYRFIKVDNAGELQIDVVSSALPTGAATESTVASLLTEATFVAEDFATQTTLAAINAAQLPDGHNVTVDNILSNPVPSQITDGTDAVDVVDDSGIIRLQVQNKGAEVSDKIVAAAFHSNTVAASTYIGMIDLDDGGGDYLHSGSSSIKFVAAAGSLIKSSVGAQWQTQIGVITRVDGTDADVTWLDTASNFALDTSKVEHVKEISVSTPFDLNVVAGVLEKLAGGFKQTNIAGINTTTGLINVEGNAMTPAVGDMVLEILQVSGGGTAIVHYSVRYFVD